MQKADFGNNSFTTIPNCMLYYPRTKRIDLAATQLQKTNLILNIEKLTRGQYIKFLYFYK